MARVFSWKLTNDEYGYLFSEKGEAGYHIGKKMENEDVATAISTVSRYDETTYETYFNGLQKAIKDKFGDSVTIEGTYKQYYSVVNSIIMITGKDGAKGDTGKGEKGEKGEKGDTGSAGKGRNVICYCGVESGFTPTRANISRGKLDTNNWHITWPTDPEGKCVWGDNNEFGSKMVVYMSNADFDNDGYIIARNKNGEFIKRQEGEDYTQWGDWERSLLDTGDCSAYTWSTPIRISGEKGDNGADGDSVEFIYKLAKDRKEDAPLNPTTAQLGGYIGGDTGKPCTFDNSKTTNDFVPIGWTDSPCGISETNKVEYMCQRTKEAGKEKPWSDWVGPTLWASWGEDGNDGDGVEYIFAITTVNIRPSTETLPSSANTDLAEHWQDPEIFDYIRENKVTGYRNVDGVDMYNGYDNDRSGLSGWTDDPQDVEESQPFEWVSIRKRKDNVWGDFSEPKLWAHYGQDGNPGNDGTSLNVKGRYATLGALLKDIHGNSEKFPPEVGDAYAIGEGDNVHMWVWMELDKSNTNSTYDPNLTWDYDNVNFTNYKYDISGKSYWFIDCGSFKGESGLTAYVHIKYAKKWTGGGTKNVDYSSVTISDGDVEETVTLCFTSNTGETPGPYIAIYTDNMKDDSDDFRYYCGYYLEQSKCLWTKFKGDDGQSYGQEQIFCRTQSNTPPSTTSAKKAGHGYEIGEKYLNVSYPASAFTTADYVPSEGAWTDVPMGIVNGVYNFEWVSTRKLITRGDEKGQWSYFSAPALYNEAVDSPTFQIEYTDYSGSTIIGLTHASAHTVGTTFDEDGWRKANSQYGTWTDDSTNATWQATANGYYKNGDNSSSGTIEWNDWIITRCRGANRFTSFVFSSAAPGVDLSNQTLTGGTYASPKPNSIKVNNVTYVWTDAPSTASGVIVWMSKAEFSSDTPDAPVGSWSKPKAMTDSADFEVIYSARKTAVAVPDGFKKDATNPTEIDSTWYKSATGAGWYDEASQCVDSNGKTGATPIWMATNTYSNGSWGKWQVSKIKGEDGKDGTNGESIFTSFAFAVVPGGISVDLSSLTLKGGSYGNPVPNSSTTDNVKIVWNDSPNSTSETDQIWMTWAQFSSTAGQKTDWTSPKLLNDTADFEVMYSAWDDTDGGNVVEPLPDGFAKDADNPVNINKTWLESANAVGWFDEVSQCQGYDAVKKQNDGKVGTTPVWMATNKYNHGTWSGWQYFKVKGEKGDPGDNGSTDTSLDYLKELFEEVDNGSGAILREFVGVKNGSADDSTIVAFMNGSSAISGDNGTLMIAAGANGLQAETSDGLQVDKANQAKFRVYSDGTMYATNANISGTINAESGTFNGTIYATKGTIGNFTIEDGCLVGQSDSGKISINPNSYEISYYQASTQTVNLNNDGMCFYDNNGDVAVALTRNYYKSLSVFAGGSSSNQTKYLSTSKTYSSQYSNNWTLNRTSSSSSIISQHAFSTGESYTYSSITISDECQAYKLKSVVDVSISTSASTTATTDTAITLSSGTNMMHGVTQIEVRLSGNGISPLIWYGQCSMDASAKSTELGWKGGNYTGYGSYSSAQTRDNTIKPGTYRIIVISKTYYEHSMYGTGGTMASTAKTSINSISLTASPINERTELFANGFGYALTNSNYVGVIRPNATSRQNTSGNVCFEAVCGDSRLVVSGGTTSANEQIRGCVDGQRYFGLTPIVAMGSITNTGYYSGKTSGTTSVYSQQGVSGCTWLRSGNKSSGYTYTIDFNGRRGYGTTYGLVQATTSGGCINNYVKSCGTSQIVAVFGDLANFNFFVFNI